MASSIVKTIKTHLEKNIDQTDFILIMLRAVSTLSPKYGIRKAMVNFDKSIIMVDAFDKQFQVQIQEVK